MATGRKTAPLLLLSHLEMERDQERAEEFYIDNVLVDDPNGRTHRLQLLGTLEDEGLIDHFSDDDKKAFRDGNFIAKEDPETGQLKVFQRL